NPERRKSHSLFTQTARSDHNTSLIDVIWQPATVITAPPELCNFLSRRTLLFFLLYLLLKFPHSQISVKISRSGLHSNSLKLTLSTKKKSVFLCWPAPRFTPSTPPESERIITISRMRRASQNWLRGVSLLLLLQTTASMVMLLNSTGWGQILDKYLDEDGDWWEAKQRGKRAITDSDAQLILDLHNKLRGQVYPPSSNMEYM
uniref:uncharacterized protein LOC117250980 n=1 Tax=Epinephelus lanceolatus TaxID=310571 RepID=UPI00144591F5